MSKHYDAHLRQTEYCMSTLMEKKKNEDRKGQCKQGYWFLFPQGGFKKKGIPPTVNKNTHLVISVEKDNMSAHH